MDVKAVSRIVILWRNWRMYGLEIDLGLVLSAKILKSEKFSELVRKF
jgi:hypothetical protein